MITSSNGTFSALLAIAGNSPVPGEFPTQRPVMRCFDVFFDLRLNKWLSKQWWGWWFETFSHSLWRHRNDIHGLVQDCSNSIANALEVLQSCTKPLIYSCVCTSIGVEFKFVPEALNGDKPWSSSSVISWINDYQYLWYQLMSLSHNWLQIIMTPSLIHNFQPKTFLDIKSSFTLSSPCHWKFTQVI